MPCNDSQLVCQLPHCFARKPKLDGVKDWNRLESRRHGPWTTLQPAFDICPNSALLKTKANSKPRIHILHKLVPPIVSFHITHNYSLFSGQTTITKMLGQRIITKDLQILCKVLHTNHNFSCF